MKKKNEDISAGDDVLIYDNTHKRSKGASLKPRFKGPYRVALAKNDFKVNVNSKLETYNHKNLRKVCKVSFSLTSYDDKNIY